MASNPWGSEWMEWMLLPRTWHMTQRAFGRGYFGNEGMVRACPELAASLGRGVRNAIAQTSFGLLETRAPREKRALPTKKLRRRFACSTPGVGAAFSSRLAAPKNTRVTDSDKWEAAGGDARQYRSKL